MSFQMTKSITFSVAVLTQYQQIPNDTMHGHETGQYYIPN